MTITTLLLRQAERWQKFMPNNLPRRIRVYDNGGVEAKNGKGSIDRYTVVMTGRYGHKTGGETWVLAMNDAPFSPQGFCQHCPQQGRPDVPSYGHLGKKIRFMDLPTDCQVAALGDYLYLWDLVPGDDESGYTSKIIARKIVEARIKG